MAIYHLHTKPISRSKGDSAVGAAAYRRAAKMHNEREGQTYNYTKKRNVVYSGINIPENSPQWIKDMVSVSPEFLHTPSEALWNKIELLEKRIDAQFAREVEFSLPIELTQEQSINLAREFIQDQFASRGMVCDWSVHWEKGNPHVHLMLTLRELIQDGFGLKNRDWNKKKLLQTWREKWSEYANFHLKLNEHNVTIDHRSYKDRGITLIPTVHQGKAVISMEERGIKTEIRQESNIIFRENLRRIAENPSVVLDKLTSGGAAFTREQLGVELGRYINDKGNFAGSYNASAQQDSPTNNLSQLVQGAGERALTSAQSVVQSELIASSYQGGKAEKAVIAKASLLKLKKEISEEKEYVRVLTPEKIAEIFKGIEQHDSVFEHDVLIKSLSDYTDNAEMFAKAVAEIKSCEELIFLGAGEDGRDRFTTRRMFKVENDIQNSADSLDRKNHIKISSKFIESTLSQYQKNNQCSLTDEQINAVKHILSPSSISCILGRAGTGKSFSLGAACEVWERKGLRVLGIALSGIASDGLSKGAGIESQTIAAFRYAIEEGKLILNKQDVIVMDEAGMTDNEAFRFVLDAVEKARAKIVLVGDPDQLQSIGPGAIFRALLERIGFAEIKTIYRQKEEWQRKATMDFASGDTEKALEAYQEKGCVHLSEYKDEAMETLVKHWFGTRAQTQKDISEYLVIAHSNEHVGELNKLIRAERVKRNEIAEGYDVVAHEGKTIKVSQNDRLLFLKKDRRVGISVKNGKFGTVESVDFTETGKVIRIHVVVDGTNEKVCINPEQYSEFMHGYAATVHKVQGATYDHNFVYASNGYSWNKFLSYVSMSRHRLTCHLYAHKINTEEEEKKRAGKTKKIEKTEKNENKDTEVDLFKRMAKKRIKDSVLDYPIAFAERRGIEAGNLLKTLSRKLTDRLIHAKNKLSDRYELLVDPKKYWDRKEKKALLSLASEQKHVRNEAARVVAEYVDANRAVGIGYQSFQKKLNLLGLSEISYAPAEFSLISKTEEYLKFKESLQERNKLAFEITKDKSLYAKAIKFYEISLQKLDEQSKSYTSSENVIELKKLIQEDKIELRDRLAFNIIEEIKPHYAYLEENGITPKQLREYACNHLKRNFVEQLDPRERKAFHAVEKYQLLSNEIGQLWAEKISAHNITLKDVKNIGNNELIEQINEVNKANKVKEPIGKFPESGVEHDVLEHFQWINRKCEKLAYIINQNKELHQKSLNFFQIGLSAPLFHYDKTTENMIEQSAVKAEKRLSQLKQRSERHERSDRVRQYHKAILGNDVEARFTLAHQIVQDKKYHHGAVVELGVNTSAVWKLINRDAKLYEHQNFYLKLSDEEKISFKLLDEYKKAKNAYGSAWREIFEAKNQLNFDEKDEKTVFEKLAIYTHPYKEKRNALAESVLLNVPDKKLQDYFNVNIVDLYPQLKESRTLETIKHYIEEKDYLKKSYWANKILEDGGDFYKKLVFEKNLSWKVLYRDSKNYRRKALFDSISLEEKRFLRLVSEYKTLNQASGRVWSALLKGPNLPNNLGEKAKIEKKQKAARFTAKRDAIAFKIMEAQKQLSIMSAMDIQIQSPGKLIYVAESKALSYEKLERQAANHQNRINAVNTFKEAYEHLQQSLSPDFFNESAILENVDYWRYLKGTLKEAIAPIKQNYALYDAALKENNFSQKVIESLETSCEKLNTSFVSLEARSKINGTLKESSFAVSWDEEQLERIAISKRILSQTKPIQGTLAERYLREHRGIQEKLESNTFRYHPRLRNWVSGGFYPALIATARDKNNEVCGIQAIFLDPKTAAKESSLGKNAKLSRGITSEGAMVHQGTPEGKIAFAEGIETALSIAEAYPDWTVHCTFGVNNFRRVPFKTHATEIVICADNDGLGSATERSVKKSAEELSASGIKVYIALPEKPACEKKWDFNDALKKDGVDAVKASLSKAQLFKEVTSKEKHLEIMLDAAKSIVDPSATVQPEKGARDLFEFIKEMPGSQRAVFLPEAIKLQVSEWAKSQMRDNSESSVLIAFDKEHVKNINKMAYEFMQEIKSIKARWHIKTDYAWMDIGVHARIRFVEDFNEKAVKANTLGTITAIKRNTITVRLEDNREIDFKLKDYDALDYGYALTIDQSKRKLFKANHILITKNTPLEKLMPILKREKNEKSEYNFYWAKEHFKDADEVKKHFNLELERSNHERPSPALKKRKKELDNDLKNDLE